MGKKLPELPAISSIGGYPIFYVNDKNHALCAKCASDYRVKETDVNKGEIHWEGSPIICEYCNEEIESAYGEPEDKDA